MPLSTASIPLGSTFTPSGGSAVEFSGQGIRNNSHSLVVEDDSLLSRRSILVTVKEPKDSSSAPNGKTQQRITYLYKRPLTLANGLTTVCTTRVEHAYDVEADAALIAELREVGAHLCTDSDFEPTTAHGTLA